MIVIKTAEVRDRDISFRLSLILITALLIGAFFVLTNDLAHTPPDVPSDATHNLGEGLRISRGIPFPADFGRAPEPTFRYLVAGAFVLFGPHVFTARMVPVVLAFLAVALTYRGGLLLLAGQRWRRLGALVAAGTVAAMTPQLILARDLYRAATLPPLVAAIFVVLLFAVHTRRPRYWAAGGFLSGLAMMCHLAGVMAPPWAAGLGLHQIIVPGNGKRIGWRNGAAFVLGLLPPFLVWLGFYLLIPNWWLRVNELSTSESVLQGAQDGLWGAVRAYLSEGYWLPTFNTPNTPFLNPALGILAVIGFALAIWRWRRAGAALLLGGMFLFTLPGALSPNPTYPIRLIGVVPLLGLLSGWGAAWVMGRVSGVFRQTLTPGPSPSGRGEAWRVRLALTVGSLILVIFSMGATHRAYHGMFDDPANYADPGHWLSIPHNFSMAFQESMRELAKVDQPTYVPMWLLDNPAAAFFLQREAFPNVTTWARYGLKELPAGQFFFPVHWYYHMETDDQSLGRVLLLPQEKTIVLLPGLGLPDSIAGPPPKAGEPGTTEIKNERGWVLARIKPVARADFTAPLEPRLPGDEVAPRFGNGLKLLTRYPAQIQRGKQVWVLLEWLVEEPQPADLFSVAQVVNQDFVPLPGGSDHHVLFYLYPSARWQPGDIIPDWHVVTIPEQIPDGIYRWGAGAYVPPGGRIEAKIQPDIDAGPQLRDLWLWDAIRVPAAQIGAQLPPDAVPLRAEVGDKIELHGYKLSQKSDTWTVTLYWQASARPQGDYIVFVHGQNGQDLVAQHDAKPTLPTWAWMPGELIATSYDLKIEAGKAEIDALYVGLYRYPSLDRLPVVQNGVSREDKRVRLWSSGQS
jgi:hypothetical protein